LVRGEKLFESLSCIAELLGQQRESSLLPPHGLGATHMLRPVSRCLLSLSTPLFSSCLEDVAIVCELINDVLHDIVMLSKAIKHTKEGLLDPELVELSLVFAHDASSPPIAVEGCMYPLLEYHIRKRLVKGALEFRGLDPHRTGQARA
jgi:hypothetical protein